MRALLRRFVDGHDGNVSAAARTLGVSRPNLHRLLMGDFRMSDRVAQRLGYRRIVRYVPAELMETDE